MSGPLGVSHLLVFSQTATSTEASLSNVNLRLSRMPRGPTLSFKVLRYALMKDVLAASKHAHSPGREYATEPLVRAVIAAVLESLT
jgi:ribosome biogenesis protein SSF1/2